MFILRTIFWLGMVILLLPTGKTEDQRSPATVSEAPALSTGTELSAAAVIGVRNVDQLVAAVRVAHE